MAAPAAPSCPRGTARSPGRRARASPRRRGGALEQRVVHVGDVLHVAHRVARVPPGAVQQVEGDVGRGMAEVRGVVRGDAADVEPRAVSAGRVGRAASPSAVSCTRTAGPSVAPGTARQVQVQARMRTSLTARLRRRATGWPASAPHGVGIRPTRSSRRHRRASASTSSAVSRPPSAVPRSSRPRRACDDASRSSRSAGDRARPTPTAPCAACARRGRSARGRRRSGGRRPSGSTWPPLRSALLTSTSKTAIRRSAALSSWTSDTSSAAAVLGVQHVEPAPAAPGRPAEVDRLRRVSGVADHSCAMPGPERARRAAPSAARRPSRAPRRRRGRDLAPGQRAVAGSPTAGARRRSACRRTRRLALGVTRP